PAILLQHLWQLAMLAAQRRRYAQRRVSKPVPHPQNREPIAHSSTTNELATGLLPHITTTVTRGCGPPMIRWIASFARMRSIRQSVQNGQFLCGSAQKPARCLVASRADK